MQNFVLMLFDEIDADGKIVFSQSDMIDNSLGNFNSFPQKGDFLSFNESEYEVVLIQFKLTTTTNEIWVYVKNIGADGFKKALRSRFKI